MLNDDEVVVVAQKLWPQLTNRLRVVLDRLAKPLVANGLTEDEAFNLVQLLMLHEIFFRMTILISVKRTEHTRVLDWIEEEFNAWDKK